MPYQAPLTNNAIG